MTTLGMVLDDAWVEWGVGDEGMRDGEHGWKGSWDKTELWLRQEAFLQATGPDTRASQLGGLVGLVSPQGCPHSHLHIKVH